MPRSPSWSRSLALVALFVGPAGCGADASASATPAQQVLRSFAVACPPAAIDATGAAAGIPQVLVDAAVFRTPADALKAASPGVATPVADALHALDAANPDSVSTPHILATNGIPAEISVSGAHGVRLWVLARLEASGAVHLTLEVDHSSDPAAPARLQASVVVPDGQVAMVSAPPGAADGEQLAMLVRPFVIRREADLARIMTCKRDAVQMQAAAER